jgi:Family of unknown function (DUF6338)
MPTTLTGLLLFVVLLLPGFAYLVGKERNGTERQTSPFRETIAIVAASTTAELAVLALFAIPRWLWPTQPRNSKRHEPKPQHRPGTKRPQKSQRPGECLPPGGHVSCQPPSFRGPCRMVTPSATSAARAAR